MGNCDNVYECVSSIFAQISYTYKIKISWNMTQCLFVFFLPTSIGVYGLILPRVDLWDSWLQYIGKERVRLLA
jgi:hypothetical protein